MTRIATLPRTSDPREARLFTTRCDQHGGLAFARRAGVRTGDLRCPECGDSLRTSTRLLKAGFAIVPDDARDAAIAANIAKRVAMAAANVGQARWRAELEAPAGKDANGYGNLSRRRDDVVVELEEKELARLVKLAKRLGVEVDATVPPYIVTASDYRGRAETARAQAASEREWATQSRYPEDVIARAEELEAVAQAFEEAAESHTTKPGTTPADPTHTVKEERDLAGSLRLVVVLDAAGEECARIRYEDGRAVWVNLREDYAQARPDVAALRDELLAER